MTLEETMRKELLALLAERRNKELAGLNRDIYKQEWIQGNLNQENLNVKLTCERAKES